MVTIIGGIASFLWAISLIPELLRTIKNKKCYVSYGMLFVILTASICSIIYTFSIGAVPLLINYSANFLIAVILLIYKIKK